MITGYPEGSNITVLNTTYQYPRRKEDGSGYSDDIMQILYRDNNTGEKKIEEIHNPDYEFYEANDDVVIDHNLFFIEKEKVHTVKVPYKNLLKKIAEDTDNSEFFYDNIKNQNRYANEQLHTIPTIFNSDLNIEDHYRFRFDKTYKNDTFSITKSYFDIETDIIHMSGDFPELGECPINAISYINVADNTVHTFLLRNPDNPLIQEFENSVGPELFAELKDFVIDHVGGEKFARKHKIIDFQYKMYFYDEEIQLIKDIFTLINICKPDFLLAWNMSFDIPYIIERIKVLGYDPAEIMCPPEVKTKIAKYYIDIRNKNKAEQRGDFFTIAGYTVYLDQLVHFASRRKGQSAFDNHKLDYIGEIVAKVGKLDYGDITHDLGKLPYLNYKVFVFYNIMDTIVQHCIENKVNDIGYIFNKCLINNTRYHKGHRQTVYLTNRGIKEFASEGFIMGNNVNRNNEKPPKFPGALVGDPRNNNDYSKVKINGQAINIAKNLDDYDYKSLYPSIMREFNIAPNTQIGRIVIDQKVYDGENPFEYDKYSRGGQFIQDFQSGNYLEFCKRWLHLGGYMDILEDMKEYFATHKPYGSINPIEKQMVRMFDINPGTDMVYFEDFVRPSSMVEMYPEKRSFEKEIEMVRNTAQMDLNSMKEIIKRRERQESENEELDEFLGIERNNMGGEDDE
jgi:DNA polymerase elongation subunit (family B)